tara:strand:+ start:1417 stop:1788 length:372 start_codon:yes stop_codon:yes gene_type:complete
MGKELPSMGQMIKNFGKEVIEYAKKGAPNVNKNQYKERLQTCNTCEFLKKDLMRCGKCGCLVEHKAKWATSTCPDKRWRQVIVGRDGKKVKIGREAHSKWKNKQDEKGLTNPSDKVQPTDSKD